MTNEYLTVSQTAQRFPAFSQSSLRHLIFNASSNGFNQVVRRIGRRRILISSEAMREWIEQQNQGGTYEKSN